LGSFIQKLPITLTSLSLVYNPHLTNGGLSEIVKLGHLKALESVAIEFEGNSATTPDAFSAITIPSSVKFFYV